MSSSRHWVWKSSARTAPQLMKLRPHKTTVNHESCNCVIQRAGFTFAVHFYSLSSKVRSISNWHSFLMKRGLTFTVGRVISQAVSRRLPTAAARVTIRVWSCGILWWTEVALGQVFPRTSVFPANLHFIYPTIIVTITRGWHNRPGEKKTQGYINTQNNCYWRTQKLYLTHKVMLHPVKFGAKYIYIYMQCWIVMETLWTRTSVAVIVWPCTYSTDGIHVVIIKMAEVNG
jgi:hypothetical protein